uniref:Ribonuclease kappa-B n=2 Tax=Sarcoptes scabiei TaxID=52283 RepID=A0A834REL7_SARSC
MIFIIMLTLMGILLYSHAVTFAEDLELHEIQADTLREFLPEAYQRYESAAHNCWIAACLYIVTLAVSMHQYVTNRRIQYGY